MASGVTTRGCHGVTSRERMDTKGSSCGAGADIANTGQRVIHMCSVVPISPAPECSIPMVWTIALASLRADRVAHAADRPCYLVPPPVHVARFQA
jgi:hypothetical protein